MSTLRAAPELRNIQLLGVRGRVPPANRRSGPPMSRCLCTCTDVPALRQPAKRGGWLCLALIIAVLGGMSLPGSSSAAPLPRIDMKVLLVGTSTDEPDFMAWEAALQREGVKFDTIVGASHTPITASN